jgi:hypothetical protein
MPRVHLRLISSTCVSSDPTPNIWRWDIDRDASGRGEALRFILVDSGRHGSTTWSSWWTCDSYSECCHSRRKKTMILSARLKSKKSDLALSSDRSIRLSFRTPSRKELATDLYYGSTPIAIKDESNHRIRFRRLQEIYNITIRND